MGDPVVQDLAVQAALNPIKLYVRAVGRKWSSRFPHQVTGNYCVWSAAKNRDLLYGRRISFLTLRDSMVEDVLILTTVAIAESAHWQWLHIYRCAHDRSHKWSGNNRYRTSILLQ